ncbi:hypothetical protein DP57_6089 [Burkholderia pseudomallei]|uniref:hypothetical protein n=1 Tax=Burkholderia pseudomallei TaxID=28450 RepID=UPI00050F8795|nr:hypothetical protein [Burkholderia pseudomallei]KGC70274.1 hypothetical protein DP57_6089 [Burkholderia pseudomallei]
MSMPAVGSRFWIEGQVRQYLASGDYDGFFAGWPGHSLVDVATHATQRLRAALVEATLRGARGFERPVPMPEPIEPWLRNKLGPMVQGLFTVQERDRVLDALVAGIVFLTPHNIVDVLTTESWLSTAWRLANLYLDSLGARRLSSQADDLVGLSQDTTCYVSLAYFDQTDPFADYVVHEAAHVLHNCRRTTIGLPERRHCATPLDIAFRQRETFAYACEAYSRIVAMAQGCEARQAALERHTASGLPPDERVDHGQYLAILAEAVRSRNGWQCIRKRCAL